MLEGHRLHISLQFYSSYALSRVYWPAGIQTHIMMRSRRSQPFFVQNVLQEISQERTEQYAAQVAAYSCEVSLDAIRIGTHNYIINSRKKPKTKYEYNQERVRDFRVGKVKPGEVVPATVEEVADELEQNGKASYFLLQTDPPLFVRNFTHDVFNETLKMLNPLHPHFHSIDKLDLSNQLIGAERFALLCEGVAKSSIRILNVSGNKLKNDSMFFLSEKLRSMHHLEDLNISRNKVSDDGISHLFDIKRYSATLQKFDCSYNTCNAFAAYYLGMMFKGDRLSRLHTLVLGGKVGLKGWGDDFFKVFMCYMIEFGVKTLRHLSIADAGLSELSLGCLTALLSCDEVVLESLNISKNEFASSTSKENFLNALRLNTSLKQLTFQQCGFSETQSRHVVSTVHAHNRTGALNQLLATHSARHRQHLAGEYQLTWQERTDVARCAAAAWSVCQHAFHKVKISFVKDNPWRIPGPPVWQVIKAAAYGSTDLLSNIATMFQNTQVVLPVSIKAALEDINRDMRYADMLVEALRLCQTLAADPRSVRMQRVSARKESEVMRTVEQIEQDLAVNERRLASYTSMRKSAIEVLFKEIDLFRTDSEAVLRVAKRRERKNIHVIIAEVSKRMNCDRVLMCAEDCRGAVSEEGQALEQLVGALYRQRLLFNCLTEEHSALQVEPFDFASIVRGAIPYYGNLTSSATFVHYFYLIFGEERKENTKIKDKVLRKLKQELNGSASAKTLDTREQPATEGCNIESEQLPAAEGDAPAVEGFAAEVAARKKKNKDRKPTLMRRRNVFTQIRKMTVQLELGRLSPALQPQEAQHTADEEPEETEDFQPVETHSVTI